MGYYSRELRTVDLATKGSLMSTKWLREFPYHFISDLYNTINIFVL